MHKLAEKWKRVWCVHRRCCWRRRRAWAFEWRWGRSWGKLLRREVCGAPWQRDWSRPTAFCQVAYSPDPPFLFPSEIGWGRRRRRPSQLGLNDVTEPLTGSMRLGVSRAARSDPGRRWKINESWWEGALRCKNESAYEKSYDFVLWVLWTVVKS